MRPEDIRVGAVYANRGAVTLRRVDAITDQPSMSRRQAVGVKRVHFTTIHGQHGGIDSCAIEAFARWARTEIMEKET